MQVKKLLAACWRWEVLEVVCRAEKIFSAASGSQPAWHLGAMKQGTDPRNAA